MLCHADEGRIVSEAYCLLPGDLRDTAACQAALEGDGFNLARPTYILAECVLVYMEPEDSAAVVRWLGHWLATAAFVVYEQVSKWRACDMAGVRATCALFRFAAQTTFCLALLGASATGLQQSSAVPVLLWRLSSCRFSRNSHVMVTVVSLSLTFSNPAT